MSKSKFATVFKDVKPILRGRIPGQVIIQYTDACNAKCPQCGMNSGNHFKRSKIDSESIKKIIDSAAVKSFKALSFTGGEPFLYFDELVNLIEYAGEAGIDYIRTGTNGFVFMNSDKPDYEDRIEKIACTLAKTKLRNFWISIDSASPSVHEEMRGLPGVIKGIEKALTIFHKHGIYPSANLGINRNIGGYNYVEAGLEKSHPDEYYRKFREAFQNFYSFVINMGFTMVNACYPMSIDANDPQDLSAVYGATSVDSVVKFTIQEKILLFKALFDTIADFRSKIRIFTPRSSLYSLIKQYQGDDSYCHPCHGGIDFFFIDSGSGNVYPCGYRGSEDFGKMWDMNLDKIDKRAFCKKCDWECFRDPSELLGPVIDLFSKPSESFKKLFGDRAYSKLWFEDMKYYKACSFYDGRKPPNYEMMKNPRLI